jgi:hypothetical protein
MLSTDSAAVISEQILQEIQRLKAVDTAAAEPSDEDGGEGGDGDAGGEDADEDGDALPDAASAEYADATSTEYADAEEVSEKEAVVLGVVSNLNFSTDFPGRNKTITIELTYPCDLSPVLTELFERLRRHGIVSRTVKAAELVKEPPRKQAS